MGTCSSAPRLNVNLRTFMATNRSVDGFGDEWYLDTMNILLDRWSQSHVQFLRKKFLEATSHNEKELDKKGFFLLFAELQDMPKAVAESAFRMFDTDNSGKLNFKEFCCALALCCQLMSSDDEKIRFVFDMFDTNDDGFLSAADLHQLLEHALPREDEKGSQLSSDDSGKETPLRRHQRVLEAKQELLGTSQQLSFDRFYDWAVRNLDSLNNLLCTFQIVPAPDRELSICEEILSRHQTLQEASTWYCISHKWLQVWKAHVSWIGPSPGRKVANSGLLTLSLSGNNIGSTPEKTLLRCYSEDSVNATVTLQDSDGFSEDITFAEIGTHQVMSARPAEIDNFDLEGEHKGELKMNLVEHLDYELIPEEMWHRLIEWYGGGPAIPRKVICMGQDHQPQVELYPPLLLVVVAGDNGQPLPQFSRRFFISRQTLLGEVLIMLAEKLSKSPDHSRIWHRSQGEQWRLVQPHQRSVTLDEFLEGKVWDAGAFLLETQGVDGVWPRDPLPGTETAEDANSMVQVCSEKQEAYEVGDRVEAQSGANNQWLRGTIVDVVTQESGSTPSQVKVHYDSTVYKCDEWISTSSQRLSAPGTHTAVPTDAVSTRGVGEGDELPEHGAVGLQNLGNTCFMNATIQCIVNTPLVREYFLSSQYLRDVHDRGNSPCKGRLAQEFGQVICELWTGSSSVFSPRDLKRCIDQLAPQFAGYEQQDAQELLAFVLDGLHEDLNRGGVSATGGSTGRSIGPLRQGTPKLFSSQPLLARGGSRLDILSPKRTKDVWKRSEQGSKDFSSATREVSEEVPQSEDTSSFSVTLASADMTSAETAHREVSTSSHLDASQHQVDQPSSAWLAGYEAASHPEPMAEADEVHPLRAFSVNVSQELDAIPQSAESFIEEDAPVAEEPTGFTDLTGIGQMRGCREASGGASTHTERSPASATSSQAQADQSASPVDSSRKAEGPKQPKTSRWWSFAWGRGRGALDLPKDHASDSPSDSPSGDKTASSKETQLTAELLSGGTFAAVAGASIAPYPSKTPSGAAGAAVLAARRQDDGSISDDGVSSTYNESEDFVPELLTPQQNQTRRSRGLFGYMRRRRPEDDLQPGTPRRRPKAASAMGPLQEAPIDEEHSETLQQEQVMSGQTGDSNAERETVPPPPPPPAPAAGSSFLPWRGTLRSREGSLERAYEEVNPEPANGRDGSTGRTGRLKEKDSLFPAFLRRAKSREGTAKQVKTAASSPLGHPAPHAGDSPIIDVSGTLFGDDVNQATSPPPPPPPPPPDASDDIPPSVVNTAVGGELFEVAAETPLAQPLVHAMHDRAHQKASSALPFTFLRTPWGTRREPSGHGSPSPPVNVGDTKASTASGSSEVGESPLIVQEPVILNLSSNSNEPSEEAPSAPSAPPVTRPLSACSVASQVEKPLKEEHSKEAEEKEVDEDHLPDDEKASLQWERYKGRNRSLIVDVFEGQLRSRLICCRCGNTSSTFEPFRTLSVPIPSNHLDSFTLKVIFFPMPSSPGDRPTLTRFSVSVPKTSTVKHVETSLSSQLPVPMSSVLLAEVYRSRIHRYLDPNLVLTDVRADDQLFAFEAPQTPADLQECQERLALGKPKQDRIEDPSKPPRVLTIQAMHRRVVDVCRSDGRTWAQRREVFGLPFVMSASSNWSYSNLHEMLMLHAGRFLRPRRDKAAPDERQVPFVARIVNASGNACGACDRRNCTGCLLPKGSARLRLRAGLITGAASTAKIYLALDWVDSAMYDQDYVDTVSDAVPKEDISTAKDEVQAQPAPPVPPPSVPLSACLEAFAAAEELQVEHGNGVKCEKCDTQVDANKKIDIWREPDVFLLHIKRFHFSGEHFEKISTPIHVPVKDLDLRPWIVGPSGGNQVLYDLYGVSCHRGGMSGGHYTSYCLNEGGKEPIWLKFNDDTVTRVTLSQELDEIYKQCYVLFYRKRAFSSSNLINYSSM